MISFILPVPPSANRYWRHGLRGKKPTTYRSKQAKEYIESVWMRLRLQGLRVGPDVAPLIPTGDVALSVTWYRKRKQGDLGNRLKILEDALEGLIYTNDSQIARYEMIARDDSDPANPRIEVTARSLEAPAGE